MKNNYDYTVIIPACNEQDNIEPLIECLIKLNENDKYSPEVILVNDGSTDRTGEMLEAIRNSYPWIKIHHNFRRRGITSCLETGHSLASTDIFVFFPADLQFSTEDIPKLVNPLIEGKFDIVTGRKIGKYEKKFVSSIYNNLSQWLFKVPVTDLNSIKAYRREFIRNIPLRKDWHRFMVVMAFEQGARVGEVEVQLFPRKAGKSKFGLFRIPLAVLDLMTVISEVRIMKKPMLTFGTLGGISIILGSLTGLIALVLRIFGYGFRPLLYLVMLLILGGLLFFVLGIIGESIASISKRQNIIMDEIEKIKKNNKNVQ